MNANHRLTALAIRLTTGCLVELAKDNRKLHWEHLLSALQTAASQRCRASIGPFMFVAQLQVFLLATEAPLQHAVGEARRAFLEARAEDIKLSLNQKQSH
eukprot:2589873-Pyramimonas_sp.AAC.1